MITLDSPLMASIQITDKCNCSCHYCYNDSNIKRSFINSSDFFYIVDDLVKNNVFRISIEGGEPFLHPNALEFIDYIEKSGISFTIITNASLITNEISSFLNTLVNGEIIVSLDSIEERIHNSTRSNYNDVIKGIENLIDSGVIFGINTVISKFNIDTCHQIISHFYPAVKKFSYLRLIPRKKDDELISSLLQYSEEQINNLEINLLRFKNKYTDIKIESPFNLSKEKDFTCTEFLNVPGCLAGSTYLTIKANMDVIPCSYCQNIIVGNLNDVKLKDIWMSNELDQIRNSSLPPCQI